MLPCEPMMLWWSVIVTGVHDLWRTVSLIRGADSSNEPNSGWLLAPPGVTDPTRSLPYYPPPSRLIYHGSYVPSWSLSSGKLLYYVCSIQYSSSFFFSFYLMFWLTMPNGISHYSLNSIIPSKELNFVNVPEVTWLVLMLFSTWKWYIKCQRPSA